MKICFSRVPPAVLGGASRPCITSPPIFPSTAFYRSYSRSLSQPEQKLNAPAVPSPKWLSDIKARIGRCIIFGLDKEQTRTAGELLRVLGEDWRDLVAGREGFLVDRKRAGLLRQKVVWGEQDSMSHVNNVTYVRWAETARINWVYNYALHFDPGHKSEWSELWSPRGTGLILRSIRTDYKFPMTWPDHISVFHKLRSLPSLTDSHFVLDVMILSELHQRPAARCVEDIVVYDYLGSKKTVILPFMMDAFLRTWEDQEKGKQRVEEQISSMEGMVEKLETDSWNRPDAKEDMGGVE